jgi:adenine-specific DNA-methyltransferase
VTVPNLLIHGDNLPVLRALLPSLEAQVQCVWIDPPYNTGQARRGHGGGADYGDRFAHDAWLDALGERLAVLRQLLHPSGSLFLQLDDTMLDYARIALDGVFGRQSLVNRITVSARAPSAFSTVNRGVFRASEYLLWVARDRAQLACHPVRIPRAPDRAYRLWLENPSDPPAAWRLVPLKTVAHDTADADRLRVDQAPRVARLAAISDTKAGRLTLEGKARSKDDPDRVLVVERPGRAPQYLLRGQQLIFYDRQVTEIDGKLSASRPLTDIWTDIAWEGIAREGGVTYKQGKKPERLVRRCLQLATAPGDLVLDCYAGSGTTPAVAHKMGRRWVAVERGDAVGLAAERLDRVVAGTDGTGVSAALAWAGGGAYRFLDCTSSTDSLPVSMA